MKLFDSELKIMEVLWEKGELPAGQIAKLLKEETGWNRNTTYTVIKKCIAKHAVERREPGFLCRPLVAKEQIQEEETQELIEKMFSGSKGAFFAALVDEKKLTKTEVEELKALVKELQ